jgi:hypothetical protein
MKRALLAVLLSAATGAAAFDQPVIRTPTCTHNNFRILEAVLPSILARSLRASRNSEGLEAAAYLDAHLGVNFRVAVDASQRDAFGGRPALGPTTMMSFSGPEDEIDIHHALLHLDGSDEELIIKDPARLERIAARFWPSIVHESSHARTSQGPYRYVTDTVIEDEYIAFERQLFFVLEQLESDHGYLGILADAPYAREEAELMARFEVLRPRYGELAKKKKLAPAEKREYKALSAKADAIVAEEKDLKTRCPHLATPDGDTALLLALFARSTSALEAQVTETYKAKERLDLDDPQLIPKAKAQTEDVLRTFYGFLEKNPLAGADRSDPAYATTAALLESTTKIVNYKQKALDFWNDPRAAPAAIAEYKALVAGVRAEAEAKKTRYALVLRPFLPEEKTATRE